MISVTRITLLQRLLVWCFSRRYGLLQRRVFISKFQTVRSGHFRLVLLGYVSRWHPPSRRRYGSHQSIQSRNCERTYPLSAEVAAMAEAVVW